MFALVQRNIEAQKHAISLTLALLRFHPLSLQLGYIQPLLCVLVSDVFSGRQHLQRVPG